MPWIHAHYQVQDFNRWKQIYDATAGVKRRYGWKRYRVFQVDGQRTNLIVMDQFEREDQAREYLASDLWRDALSQMGVSGTPEVLLLDGLEEGPA
jgi:hypothetical protein